MTKKGWFLGALTLLSLLLAVFRDAIFAHQFGTGIDMTAWAVAQTLPLIVLNVFLGGAIVGAFVPEFHKRLQNIGPQNAYSYGRQMLVKVSLSGSAFAFFLFIAAKPIVVFVAPGLSPAAQQSALTLTRLCALALVPMSFASISAALLNAHHKFIAAGARPLLSNIGILSFVILFSNKWGASAAAVGFVSGALLQVLVQLPALLRILKNNPAPWQKKKKKPAQRLLLFKNNHYLAVLLVHVLIQSITLLDRRFGSFLGDEILATYGYGERFVNVARSLLAGSLAVIIFPAMTKEAAAGRSLKKMTEQALIWVSLLTLPLGTALWTHGNHLSRVLFAHGAFNEESLTQLATLFIPIALLVPLFGMLYIFERAYIAKQQTRPLILSLSIALVINATCKYLFSDALGISSLVWGNVFGLSFTIAYLCYRHIFVMSGQLTTPLKTGILSGLIYIPALFAAQHLGQYWSFTSMQHLALGCLTGIVCTSLWWPLRHWLKKLLTTAALKEVSGVQT